MRTFGTIMALLLIFFGLVVAGLVVVRIWQANHVLWLDIDTASLDAGGAETGSAPPANGEPFGAADVQEPPMVVGVESGGMALSSAQAPAPDADVIMAVPGDELDPTIEVLPTVDPCPPALAEGFAADTAVVAVGTLRVYSQADVTSRALSDLSAGQGLWIVAGEGGSTAIKRCEVVWQRVRTADGLMGWVLEDAIDVVVLTVVAPTVVPTAVPTISTSPCVSGCVQPGCVQPCPTPCYQPCTAQPCTTPCGVYSQ